MAQANAGPEEQLRLTKMLNAFGRLVDVERKRIRIAYDRLIEMGAEIERVTDCLNDSDDALTDSVSGLELAHDRLSAALFGEEEGAEEEPSEVTEEEEVVEVVEIDEVEGDYETATIPISGP